jgi:hypothetical protein
MTRERSESAAKLAEEFGDPLEDILRKRARWQAIYDEQMAKPSRRRNPRKLAEAEEKILRYNEAALPFMRPKFQAITTTDTTPRLTVIRTPEVIRDSQAWLEKYRPKRDDAVNDQPPALSHHRNVLDAADSLGIDDAQTILNEAVKRPQDKT